MLEACWLQEGRGECSEGGDLRRWQHVLGAPSWLPRHCTPSEKQSSEVEYAALSNGSTAGRSFSCSCRGEV